MAAAADCRKVRGLPQSLAEEKIAPRVAIRYGNEAKDCSMNLWQSPAAAPPFRPHLLLRGGHLQTIFGTLVADAAPPALVVAARHQVDLPDGDAIVLHENRPPGWKQHAPAVLLIHGLCGCHTANYMVRLATRFYRLGVRTFRMDMRGCGAALQLARQLTHAGRSDDVLAALRRIASITDGPLWVVGVSLGGNQVLRGLGEVGSDPARLGFPPERLARAAAVCPPVDLRRCSDHMQRLAAWPYNRYFVRLLLRRIPPGVRQSEAFQQIDLQRTPRTLRQLDEQFTAPLSGFASADHYYAEASAAPRVSDNRVPTLVLASDDDPLVPAASIQQVRWPAETNLCITRRGGHVGFLGSGPQRRWMDDCLLRWFTG